MLRVVKSESVSGGAVAVRRFVFEFDNGSYLPVNTYQLGLTTYIIADDSEGINIEDNNYYIYKNGKWNLSHNEIPTSYNDTTITNNGIHSVSNNDIVGYNDVEVDVPSDAPTLIEKTITENGEYSAEDDGADGYSSVDVNVKDLSSRVFWIMQVTMTGGPGTETMSVSRGFVVVHAQDGVATFDPYESLNVTPPYSSTMLYVKTFYIPEPVNRINSAHGDVTIGINFIAGDNFDGIYVEGIKKTLTGDNIVSGGRYSVLMTGGASSYEIVEHSAIGDFTI